MLKLLAAFLAQKYRSETVRGRNRRYMCIYVKLEIKSESMLQVEGGFTK